ncbi:hypothetical protein TSUD_45910 [Trifolium subterraneum]|nr:hypothetical protein TSUD_45910 [Trifolium subterraneum]
MANTVCMSCDTAETGPGAPPELTSHNRNAVRMVLLHIAEEDYWKVLQIKTATLSIRKPANVRDFIEEEAKRSLLSQTPISGGPKFSTTFSPDNVTMSASIGESEFALESKKESVNGNATIDVLCDDQFYNDIDFDELEAQATSILKRKLDLSIPKQDINPQSHESNLDVSMSPLFDLGI